MTRQLTYCLITDKTCLINYSEVEYYQISILYHLHILGFSEISTVDSMYKILTTVTLLLLNWWFCTWFWLWSLSRH